MSSASIATLDSVLDTLTTSSTKWVVLLTANPASDTAPALHAVRFTGSSARSIATNGWTAITGTISRSRSNASQVVFGTSTAAGVVTVSHWALVTTSDNNAPDTGTTFGNVASVLFVSELVNAISVPNNSAVRFAAGTLRVEVGTS
jgi:hypothetical protein